MFFIKQKLNGRQLVLVGSMLFGLFFGAGNLIFPLILGASAGTNLPAALVGLLITAVGIPLLGIVSIGISRSEGLLDLSGRVSTPFRYLFTCALYLTIGPLFAIPRCAATSFTIGVQPLVGDNATIAQLIFSTLFFAAVLFFALRTTKILHSEGKFLTHSFLNFLEIMLVTDLLYMDRLSDAAFTGGDAFAIIARHYFGQGGSLLLAATVTLCCMKTAIGLVVSCSETFGEMFPNKLRYWQWAVLFTGASFLISNVGLSKIIELSGPVLYFLYPLAIALILVGILGSLFGHSRILYQWTILLTLVAALLELARVLKGPFMPIVDWASSWLPLYSYGLGWVVPAILGIIIGLLLSRLEPKEQDGSTP